MLAGDLNLLALNLPGHGSNPLGNFVPTLDHYARWLGTYLQKQETKIILMGHSMGGVISLTATARGYVKPVAVINLDGSLPPAPGVLAGKTRLEKLFQHRNYQARLKSLLREAFFLPGERDERQSKIVTAMSRAPDAVLRFLPHALDELRPEQILPKIQVPVLYIGSEIPRFDEEEARRLCPHATFRQIHGAGHFLPIYAAETIKPILQDFLLQHGLL